MNKEIEATEMQAVILSELKKIVKHFKLDRRKPDDEGADSESAPEANNAMLENIGLAISELSARRTFTEEQKELMLRMFNASTNFLHKGQIDHQAELKSLLEIITRKLDEQPTETLTTTIRHEYHFSLDFKNSKAALTMIAMGVAIAALIGFNIYQFDKNNNLRDNDIKYRYVKMRSGATAGNIEALETIFTYNRNADSVRLIRRQVGQYERLVKEQAEKIEQARLNASEAERLQNQAETVKKGK